MSSKAYFLVSGTIFGLMAVAHLVRVFYEVLVHVGGWAFPVWAAWGGFVMAGALGAWASRLLRK